MSEPKRVLTVVVGSRQALDGVGPDFDDRVVHEGHEPTCWPGQKLHGRTIGLDVRANREHEP
jgi:hypothetical protein